MVGRISRFVGFFVAGALFAQPPLDRITPDSLRASITYLASDELEGRATPSPGLDKAADFIAEQFKKAGLEPIDGSYFQTATVFGGSARNVVGLLRGSDPTLRNSYIIVSAHYDHVGLAKSGDDLIFNGANDDASGTASVIELAKAMAAAKPKRSILFMTFFGEERGLLGSKYYGQHPLVPLSSTIAQINLEQMGRTDASNGPQIKGANLTGFDMSNLPEILARAAEAQGVRIWKDEASSDRYFGLSDNQSLADLGIPAHTVSVAYQFPDYHKVSDTADKIDYENMAAVDRAIALGLLKIANDSGAPIWNESYAPAQKYVEAARKLHAAPSTNKTVE
jgi:Zn-dependent M28 family amino/carboxypeptidase